MEATFTFEAELFRWDARDDASWIFVTLPLEVGGMQDASKPTQPTRDSEPAGVSTMTKRVALFGGTGSNVSGPTGPMVVVFAGVFAALSGNPALVFAAVVLAGLLQIL